MIGADVLRLRRAFLLGLVAFSENRARVPALDAAYVAMMVGRFPGDGGDGVPVARAWLAGFDHAAGVAR